MRITNIELRISTNLVSLNQEIKMTNSWISHVGFVLQGSRARYDSLMSLQEHEVQ